MIYYLLNHTPTCEIAPYRRISFVFWRYPVQYIDFLAFRLLAG